MKRILSVLLIMVLMPMMGASVTLAAPGDDTFPKIIPVPDGFYPEGIAVGRGTDFFVGSLLDGDIYRGDLRTGEGSVLVQKEVQDGDVAVGLAVDRRTNYLFVAGCFSTARVYDAGTGGDPVAVYQLTTESFPNTFVNDVIVTRDAAYFTDSFRPFIYRVPLGPGGALPNPSAVEEIPLGGDFFHVSGDINANGIVATPDGKWLIISNTSTGSLYLVNPETGSASQIDLGGGLPSGSADGLLLDGKTLYVMQNILNQISEVRLASDLASGEVIGTITDSAFAVPTTIAEFGSSIYAINARFDMGYPPFFGGPLHDPPLEYDVVKVPKH